MRNLFGGYYYKFQSKDQTMAVIVAHHEGQHSGACSIQIITNRKAYCFEYPGSDFVPLGKSPNVKIRDNLFSEKRVRLSLHEPGFDLEGCADLSGLLPLAYDIMGPFALVPHMECRHSVFSMTHKVNGSFVIDGEKFDFTDAMGYIEGDRGYSFPKRYLWTQCLFDGGSLMLSAADIPIGPLNFTGIIGFVLLGGKEIRIATYLGARPVRIGEQKITVKQGDYLFEAQLIDKTVIPLRAPDLGHMTRTIRENASCKARYVLTQGSKVLLNMESALASFEYEY